LTIRTSPKPVIPSSVVTWMIVNSRQGAPTTITSKDSTLIMDSSLRDNKTILER
jgi:hypothetical protein